MRDMVALVLLVIGASLLFFGVMLALEGSEMWPISGIVSFIGGLGIGFGSWTLLTR
jgi:hypothetical protein